MAPITIMTWLWSQPNGRASYTADYVNIWADMMRRNLTMPHRLACVTDTPEGIASHVEIIEPPRDFENDSVPSWGPEKPQCLRRLALFAPDAGERFGHRFVSMDLDCVVAGNLDSLFLRPEDAVFYESPGPVSNPRAYNGSMLMLTAGARPQVYTQWCPEQAKDASKRLIGSDQAWFSHVLGRGEAVWNESDGIDWWQNGYNRGNPRLMFFPGSPKPWDVCKGGLNDWVAEHYHADAGGTCIYADCGPSLWNDVANVGKNDGAIVTPEVADVWPGRVIDEAYSLRIAKRLSHMYGFTDMEHCGRYAEQA